MNLTQLFLSELQNEAINTRKMLEEVPSDSLNWKPHEKSMALGKLATHTAEMTGWIRFILKADELNFATMPYQPPIIKGTEDLLSVFESNLADAINVFEEVTDEAVYQQTWKLKHGDHLISEQSKYVAIRSLVINHIVHHRAQLSVYLRFLDIPVPGMYGPSADEM
jgi:uncharacterized damage-inducible protein DinB